VPNLVASSLASDGRVMLYNAQGTTHLVADAADYYSST
jgi:hypothetical protein